MVFRREIIDPLFAEGITRFIIIAENVLNFHSSERDYYEEWFENVTDENGWIVCLNMPEATQHDFRKMKLNYYVELREMHDWRRYQPEALFKLIDNELKKRLA
jgi:MFS superfamily sulfate permease-like transporter